MDEQEGKTGWTKMYLKGVPDMLVTLPVVGGSPEEMAAAARKLLEFFQPTNPGLEPGQMKTVIVGCVRFVQQSDRSGDTPAVHLYREYFGKEGTEFKTETVYFDPKYPQRLAAFEKVSGIAFADMPVWDAEAPPSWKARADVLDRYMIKPEKPFVIVQKPNPKHEAETDEAAKKKIKSRLFVGFIDPETGEVIGGYDDVGIDSKATASSTVKSSTPALKQEPPKGEDTFAQSRGKNRQQGDGPLKFKCNRISVAQSKVAGRDKMVIRFFSPFDEGNVASAVAFSRDPFRKGIGENNADFFFLNAEKAPYFDALKEFGDYYPSQLLGVTAHRSGTGDAAYWVVEAIALLDEKGAIPGVTQEEPPQDTSF